MMYRDLFGGIKDAYQRVVDNTPQWLKDAATRYIDIHKDQDKEARRENLLDLQKETVTSAAEGALDKYQAPQVVRDYTLSLIDEADNVAKKSGSLKEALAYSPVSAVKAVGTTVGKAAVRGLTNFAEKVNDLTKKPTQTQNVYTQASTVLPHKGGAPKFHNLPYKGDIPKMQNLPFTGNNKPTPTPYKFNYKDIFRYLGR
jgi:hypothetical protein